MEDKLRTDDSTVVDCRGHMPVILRQGPISLEDLLQRSPDNVSGNKISHRVFI